MAKLRFAEVSAPRQALIRQCQRIGFGEIGPFQVRDREPVITSETEIFIDLKLDGHDGPRPEQNLSDFALSREVLWLLANLDAIRNGVVQQLEVRAGLPRRMVLKAPAQNN
jgi:hypothetical protein